MKKKLTIIDLPYLVIHEIAGECYVAARFMIEDTAMAYVQSKSYGNYYALHESQLEDEYKVIDYASH